MHTNLHFFNCPYFCVIFSIFKEKPILRVSFSCLLVLYKKMVVIGKKKNKKAKARNRLPNKKKRRQWNVREKLMVVHYMENNGGNKRFTAREFGIQPKQVRDWNNNKAKLVAAAPYATKLHPGKSAKFPSLEEDLYTWINERRNNQNAVTRKMIVKKAISLSKEQEFLANHPDAFRFKFSNQWLDGFLTRYNLSKRRRTTVAQQLPSDLLEKQNVFLSYVLYKRLQYNYSLKFIANMDETPLWFDLPSNTTIDHKGAKSVSIRTTGHERSSFTVVLACMADGSKLPAVCIFKLKNIPREKFPHGIYIRANEKGWMNEREMLWWIENVWTSRNPFGNSRSLLVLDSFRGHIVDSVKNRFVEKNTDIAIIPGGCTSKLQPLDVAINKSFKSKVFIYIILFI
jgi:hypothetical protein